MFRSHVFCNTSRILFACSLGLGTFVSKGLIRPSHLAGQPAGRHAGQPAGWPAGQVAGCRSRQLVAWAWHIEIISHEPSGSEGGVGAAFHIPGVEYKVEEGHVTLTELGHRVREGRGTGGEGQRILLYSKCPVPRLTGPKHESLFLGLCQMLQSLCASLLPCFRSWASSAIPRVVAEKSALHVQCAHKLDSIFKALDFELCRSFGNVIMHMGPNDLDRPHICVYSIYDCIRTQPYPRPP